MRKLVSIVLLTLYLFSTTELCQLLKIPVLIEHYREHKRLNPEMTVTAFLRTHYDHPVKDGDYGKDRKLPFVVHSNPLILVFTVQPYTGLELRHHSFKVAKSVQIPVYNEDFCRQEFLNSIWEPPKYS
ncbi:hypothetical protein [uncultured Chryseobacterium sp.]|uniref:hypothetical protein n=1 Tax=uncultured Chryseobacterium sp. TaxID=259322 RepID=UPI0025D7CC4B|nr:hypothetical protein [uncultured Chryseobacterium sp.]